MTDQKKYDIRLLKNFPKERRILELGLIIANELHELNLRLRSIEKKLNKHKS